jgi:hypothetical protein
MIDFVASKENNMAIKNLFQNALELKCAVAFWERRL